MERKLSLLSCTTEDVLKLYMPPATVRKPPATNALAARQTNSDGHRRHLRLTAIIVRDAETGRSATPGNKPQRCQGSTQRSTSSERQSGHLQLQQQQPQPQARHDGRIIA